MVGPNQEIHLYICSGICRCVRTWPRELYNIASTPELVSCFPDTDRQWLSSMLKDLIIIIPSMISIPTVFNCVKHVPINQICPFLIMDLFALPRLYPNVVCPVFALFWTCLHGINAPTSHTQDKSGLQLIVHFFRGIKPHKHTCTGIPSGRFPSAGSPLSVVGLHLLFTEIVASLNIICTNSSVCIWGVHQDIFLVLDVAPPLSPWLSVHYTCPCFFSMWRSGVAMPACLGGLSHLHLAWILCVFIHSLLEPPYGVDISFVLRLFWIKQNQEKTLCLSIVFNCF